MAEHSTNLAVIITGRGKDLINEFKKVGKEAEASGSKTHAGWKKASDGIKMAGAAIAGTAVAIGVASVHMADDYEKAHGRLEVALKNSHTSWEAQKRVVDAASDSAVRFGYTKTDVEGALAGMVTGMGSSEKALKAFHIAEDLAAAKGIDLASAAMLVTKASEGQIKPLKALGIDLPVAAGGALKMKKAQDALAKALKALGDVQTKVHMGLIKGPAAVFAMRDAQDKLKAAQDKLNETQKTGDTILQGLSDKLGGSASAQSKTFEGRVKAMKAELGNLGIKIGMALMPILQHLMDMIQDGIKWFQKHHAAAKALGIILGVVLVAAVALYTASMVAAAAATIAATWPILAVIGVVALLVLGAKALGIKWENVWRGMQIWAEKPGIRHGIALIRNVIGWVTTAIEHLKDIWPGIWAGIGDVVIGAVNIVSGAINQVIRGINDLIQGLNDVTLGIADIPKVPTLGSLSYPVAKPGDSNFIGPLPGHPLPPGTPGGPAGPPAPHTALGGIVMGPQVRLVGEAGPEAIIPLSRASGMGNTTIHVHVNGIVSGHPHEVGKFISDQLIKYERKTGKRWLAV